MVWVVFIKFRQPSYYKFQVGIFVGTSCGAYNPGIDYNIGLRAAIQLVSLVTKSSIQNLNLKNLKALGIYVTSFIYIQQFIHS